MLVCKEVFNQSAVSTWHAGVVDGKSKGQKLPQRSVLARLRLLLQDLLARRRVLQETGAPLQTVLPLILMRKTLQG